MPGGDRPRGRGKDADYGVSNNHADCIFLLSLSIFLSLSAYLSAFTRSVTRKPMDLSCFLARLHLPPMEHPWRKNFKKSRKEITENRISYFCFIGKKGKKKKNFEFGVVDYISIISLILKMRKINSLSLSLHLLAIIGQRIRREDSQFRDSHVTTRLTFYRLVSFPFFSTY